MITVIAGMSCAGKDTIQNYLLQKGYTAIISTTTRPMRPKEINGIQYYFKTVPEFLDLIRNNELVEWREYHTTVKGLPDTWYYGVEKKFVDLSENNVVVLDSTGYYKFVETYGKENVRLVWVDLDTEERRRRNILRLDYDECEFNRREVKDTEMFGDLSTKADIVISNDADFDALYKQVDEKILHI